MFMSQQMVLDFKVGIPVKVLKNDHYYIQVVEKINMKDNEYFKKNNENFMNAI